jgi:hypothetical protein
MMKFVSNKKTCCYRDNVWFQIIKLGSSTDDILPNWESLFTLFYSQIWELCKKIETTAKSASQQILVQFVQMSLWTIERWPAYKAVYFAGNKANCHIGTLPKFPPPMLWNFNPGCKIGKQSRLPHRNFVQNFRHLCNKSLNPAAK